MPRIFIDGSSRPYDEACWQGLACTCRYPFIRTVGNFVLSLWELYLRQPTADRYAIFQDDAIFCKNLRAYLERCSYPEKGYLNLYTFSNNESVIQGKPPGWYEASLLHSQGAKAYHGKQQQTGRGAVALVFDRAAVQALLTSPNLVQKPLDAHAGHRRVDGMIVQALNEKGFREWVHNPSLTQHIGVHSSMGNRPHKQALTFPGEEFDALSLLTEGDHAHR